MKIDQSQVADRLNRAFTETFLGACYTEAEAASRFCESPIEAMLLGSFLLYSRLEGYHGAKPFFGVFADAGAIDFDKATVGIVPQHTWMSYRIDFCFVAQGLTSPIFVECDGHEFHERTKEQASKDKLRDRRIQEANIPILRFTGSEIYRDPLDCAHQIIRVLGTRRASKGGRE